MGALGDLYDGTPPGRGCPIHWFRSELTFLPGYTQLGSENRPGCLRYAAGPMHPGVTRCPLVLSYLQRGKSRRHAVRSRSANKPRPLAATTGGPPSGRTPNTTPESCDGLITTYFFSVVQLQRWSAEVHSHQDGYSSKEHAQSPRGTPRSLSTFEITPSPGGCDFESVAARRRGLNDLGVLL